MLRWEQKRLAEAAQVSLETVKRIEGMTGPVSANVATVDAIQRALEAAGVVFIAENGGGPGVRLRDLQAKR
jgi:predicted transcriptional regulator